VSRGDASRKVLHGSLLVLLLMATVLSGCGTIALFAPSATVYDLLQRPEEFAGRDVDVVGVYLDKAVGTGGTHIRVLLPGVTTSGGKDTQPIVVGESCPNGDCLEDSAAGAPFDGVVWLDGPLEGLQNLPSRSADATWGAVEVKGRFEVGKFGTGGFAYRIDTREALPLQNPRWETALSLEQKPLGEGKVSLFDLADNPAQFTGKRVTTQGYYFWSPTTQGLLVEKIDRESGEVARSIPPGPNPRPAGRIILLEGFPPEFSPQLNFGPNNSFVWGLVEVTGILEAGGPWGPYGEYHLRLTITDGLVKVIGR